MGQALGRETDAMSPWSRGYEDGTNDHWVHPTCGHACKYVVDDDAAWAEYVDGYATALLERTPLVLAMVRARKRGEKPSRTERQAAIDAEWEKANAEVFG
jgi:hypothetical protein